MHRIFVYGTLKQGFSNHHRIFGGYDIKITPAFTYGKLYDLGWYPAMTKGSEKVYGELVEFDNPKILQRVDYLEGYKGENHSNNYYERREVDVFVRGDIVKAWVYFMDRDRVVKNMSKLINSGEWSVL